MADRWYFARDGEQQGPFSSEQFKDLATTGQLQPLDAVWKEGAAARAQAGKVKGLFAGVLAQAAAPAGPQALPEVSESPLPPDDETPPAAEEEPSPDAYHLEVPDNVTLLSLDDKPWLVAEPPAIQVAEKPEAKKAPPGHEVKVRKKRVTGIKGGVICGQDGVMVRFRKKCIKCGHEDSSQASMAIRDGSMKANFFCPKCKKNQQVELRGASN
jgi:hypothetical protein